MTDARRWAASVRPPTPAAWLAPAVLAVVCLLAVWPFFEGRYVFFLDQVVGPAWQPFESRLAGLHEAAYGGSLPLFAAVGAVDALVGPALAQKALLCGVLGTVAVAGYLTLPGPRWARLYGALLLLVNPFVYERVLAGQTMVVWGVGLLPVALYAFDRYLVGGTRRGLVVAVGSVTLLGFNAHALYAGTLLFSTLTVVTYLGGTRAALRRAVAVGLVALPVNAYWLGPGLLAGEGPLSGVTASDLVAFAPQVDAVSALFTTAAMGGFWSGEYASAVDRVAPLFALYAGVLFLAVYGALTYYDDERHGRVVKALATTSVVALFLGAGTSGPAAPVFRWLFDTVPFFAGMRDANKFVALLVVAYAYLGALGVSALLDRVRAVDARRWVRIAVVCLLVALPLGYTVPMVTGYAGQVQATDYPAEWYETREFLDAEADAEHTLFLPWHRYTTYSWIGDGHHRVSTPARQFFPDLIVRHDSTDDSVSRRVASLFGLDDGTGPKSSTDLGTGLADLDVGYVVLTKETGWHRYSAALAEGADLTLVGENDYFEVYRNDAAVDGTDAASGPVADADQSARESYRRMALPSYTLSALVTVVLLGYGFGRPGRAWIGRHCWPGQRPDSTGDHDD